MLLCEMDTNGLILFMKVIHISLFLRSTVALYFILRFNHELDLPGI